MRKIIFFLILFVFHLELSSQCGGNLGENIFTNGDFGSGTANILTPDPQIAPGYTYETNPPPLDGSYTISNNTSSWGDFAENWANIMDNSSDPNGYMMVVNASYDPGLFYQQQVQGLCEDTEYVFSADIFNLADGIRPNVSFLIDGNIQYSTGDVPYNFQWNTYGFSFSTAPGQTSVLLSLQNNAEGGIGNDIALDNISFRACGPESFILPEAVDQVCEDDPFIDLEATIIGTEFSTPFIQWQESFDGGNTWINIVGATDFTYTHSAVGPGLYYYRYLLANDPSHLSSNTCRVNSNVKIIEVNPKNYNMSDSICNGGIYYFGNQEIETGGTYIDTFTSSIGCDSIITLELFELGNSQIVANIDYANPSCNGDENGYINIESISNGEAPYIININGIENQTGYIDSLVNGAYNLLIIDQNGCTFEEIIHIIEPPLFEVNLGQDLVINLGESIQINPFYSLNPSTFEWIYNMGEIPCDDICNTLEWAPPYSTEIQLVSTNNNGCIASDIMYVQVTPLRLVYIPNSFSPNGDGMNDYFTIYASLPNVLEIEELLIFNRWGELVFQKNNFEPNIDNLGWDGKFKGNVLNPSTFLYSAKIKFLDGKVKEYFGDITLLR